MFESANCAVNVCPGDELRVDVDDFFEILVLLHLGGLDQVVVFDQIGNDEVGALGKPCHLLSGLEVLVLGKVLSSHVVRAIWLDLFRQDHHVAKGQKRYFLADLEGLSIIELQ